MHDKVLQKHVTMTEYNHVFLLPWNHMVDSHRHWRKTSFSWVGNQMLTYMRTYTGISFLKSLTQHFHIELAKSYLPWPEEAHARHRGSNSEMGCSCHPRTSYGLVVWRRWAWYWLTPQVHHPEWFHGKVQGAHGRKNLTIWDMRNASRGTCRGLGVTDLMATSRKWKEFNTAGE